MLTSSYNEKVAHICLLVYFTLPSLHSQYLINPCCEWCTLFPSSWHVYSQSSIYVLNSIFPMWNTWFSLVQTTVRLEPSTSLHQSGVLCQICIVVPWQFHFGPSCTSRAVIYKVIFAHQFLDDYFHGLCSTYEVWRLSKMSEIYSDDSL